ncbi:MAG: 16S rRNA (guanine(527)-N(7))-methyltransferase RsmG [Actinobacteria bacterium]|nr:16S rRNA (guanine(527)-N(7))-methyltransferase RsmG [Actinomycetota bacterium]
MKNNLSLRANLKKLCINACDKEINRLLQYLELLYAGNKELNLTGTKDKNQILIRHIFDSLGIFQYFNICSIDIKKNIKIIDVGTGAGLPGIPISLFLKNSEIFLLDSKKKIIDFLEGTAAKLQLLNTRVLSGRAESVAQNIEYFNSFDIVTARAVAKVSILAEITLPFCRVGGTVVLYKSRKLHEELDEAESKIKAMGAKVEGIIDLDIPELDEYRALLILKKEFTNLFKNPR